MKILETYHTGQTGYSNGPTPGVVVITDDMPGWNQDQWRAAMKANGIEPDPQPFRPSFLLAFGFDSISGLQFPLNYQLFADAATAQFVADRYGTGKTREVDFFGPGPYGADKKMIEFQLLDDRWVNAGAIAKYYENNPEDQFPGVADKLIKGVLVNAQAINISKGTPKAGSPATPPITPTPFTPPAKLDVAK